MPVSCAIPAQIKIAADRLCGLHPQALDVSFQRPVPSERLRRRNIHRACPADALRREGMARVYGVSPKIGQDEACPAP